MFYKEIVRVMNEARDYGCGTGKMAEVAFADLDIRRFTFVDTSEKMMEIVRKRFSLTKSEFNVCNILNIPYTEEFDVVTAIQVNHYFHKEQKIDVLRKCNSALKHSGIYIGFENFMPYTEYGKHLALEKWKSYQICQGRTAKECQEHINRFGVGYFPITIPEHIEILNLAGFDAAEILWVSNMQVGVYAIKN
ncbi:MAG: class I SAM-dependent methyltransferase [Lachnospiraceae bacterium]|nr:class I SAM-dependent methyltransferase [Lachnospiraceae bacterium]